MAEAIGLIASIVQLVDVVATARNMLKDLSTASEQQAQLLSEISSLQPLLFALQDRLRSDGATANTASLSINTTLYAFEQTMRQSSAKLQAGGVFNKFKKPISWMLWDKKEAKADLDKVERFKSSLNTWLTMDIRDLAQQHDKILTSLERSAREQQQNIDDTERTAILKWMSPVNFFERQADVFSTWQPGTGGWLLASSEFRDWENVTGKTLWCHGMPGAGKTVLASLVVNHLELRAQKENIGIACMYLNHKELGAHTPSNLLGALWRQLVWGKPIPESARAVFRHHKERDTKITLDEVQTVLISALAPYAKVYVVVDALDEYAEAQRGNLLRNLRSMGDSVNVMITSRPHIEPHPTIFPHLKSLEIRGTQEDMRHYITAQITTSDKLSKHARTRVQLRDEIESEILANVDGMFLLAKLLIDSLTTKNTIKAVREALHHLPKTLQHTYDQAMERIDQQSEDDKELAYLTLTWVANAKRLLSVRELQEALAIEPDTTTLDPDNTLDISIALSVCAGLVTVDETASVVRLIHHTTQDYLDHIQPQRFPQAQTEITSRFLTYFGFEEFSTLPKKKDEQDKLILEYPLLGYGQYWLSHAAGQPEEQLLDRIEDFLGKVSEWREFWRLQWGYQSESLPQEVAWLTGKPPSLIALLLSTISGSGFDEPMWPMSPLCIAAAGNLQKIAGDLLQKGLSSDISDALQTASYCGHLPMVALLLDHGADPNLPGEYCEKYLGTALQAAAFQGHHAVVQCLLDHGADINALGGNVGTALQAAAREGNEALVRFLLDKGADVNTLGGWYETALQAAAAHGGLAIVQLLIQHGAEVNFLGGSSGSALQAASFAGDEAVVEFLIQCGAVVNASEAGRYGTSLQAAACKGQDAVVRILLEHGADVNARAGYYGTSLQAAAHDGEEAVIRLLLQHGAEVNAQGGPYGTALVAAIVSSKGDSVARLLVEHGADVNIVGGQYATALQAAATWKNQPMVELLLEHGADPRILGGDHGSALHAAAHAGEEGIVRLLIERGADVNTLAGEYGTALQVAACEGKENVVELLLQHGAEVNAVGGKYGTALQAAVVEEWVTFKGSSSREEEEEAEEQDTGSSVRQSIVTSLIQHGADVNIRGGVYETALQAAAYAGNEAVVILLIESGAEVNADGGEYGSALQAARAGDRESLVDILLKHGAT
ncbi:ankyrin repeat-containing domain protein [Mycena sanguinolenta]|nr:ankyrin repeat-containing domain protein [Mycena sanguinolenta]